jgi:hypothetical protein
MYVRGSRDGRVVCVNFSDIRDAARAFHNSLGGPGDLVSLDPKSYAHQSTGEDGPFARHHLVSNFEGQLKANVTFDPQNPRLTAAYAIAVIKHALGSFGKLKAIHSVSTVGSPQVKEYLVEYFDLESAFYACQDLNKEYISVRYFQIDPIWWMLTLEQDDLFIKLEHRSDDINTAAIIRGYVEQPSITGRSTVPVNDPIYYPLPTRLAAGPQSFGPHVNLPPPNHNQVDIRRIRLGLDVRTTVGCSFVTVMLMLT